MMRNFKSKSMYTYIHIQLLKMPSKGGIGIDGVWKAYIKGLKKEYYFPGHGMMVVVYQFCSMLLPVSYRVGSFKS